MIDRRRGGERPQALEQVQADRFDNKIGPGQLAAQVANAAPWYGTWPVEPLMAGQRLSQVAGGPMGFLRVLAGAPLITNIERPSGADRLDYFAYCLACHHATVATYIPTDVDTKIRGILWERGGSESIRERLELVEHARRWSLDRVSTRYVVTPSGPVSGHDGEWLGVLAGALGAAIRAKDAVLADEVGVLIDEELRREASAFERLARKPGPPEDAWNLIRLGWILTHNVGDLDQGISFWPTETPEFQPWRERFAEMAHGRDKAYGGSFARAKVVYQTVSAEGHRHYPLRPLKCLRRAPELLLPLGPCFEAWGEAVATHPALSLDDRAEVLGALLGGIAKVAGQQGYQRAVYGLATATSGGVDALAKRLPAGIRAPLKDPDVRRHLGLAPSSFLSAIGKRARAALI